jgi:succinate dehydrogenase/fumarate reductase flavoprotein subunit
MLARITSGGFVVIDAKTRGEERLRVSRRGFLKASGAGAATIGAASLPFAASKAAAQQAWDAETDIVVVGSGGAGFAAAITARGMGAEVIMLEKGTYVGGTTLASGGGMWIPNNTPMREAGFEDPREDALKYMARYSWGHLYNPDSPTLGLPQHDFDMISAYYDNAAAAMDFITETGANRFQVSAGYGPNNDEVQWDYMPQFEENAAPQGRTVSSYTEDGSYAGGAFMIGKYEEWSRANGVDIRLNHRVVRVILNDAGEVVGVEATIMPAEATSDASPVAMPEMETIAIRARKGVIFGSGGYRQSAEKMHELSLPYYGGCAAMTNEGDFLDIASSVSARLGNMHGVWRNQSVLEQALAAPTGYNCSWYLSGDSFVTVNLDGKRFMNEKNSYQDRPRAHHDWETTNGVYRNLIGVHIWDTRLQENWGGRFPWPVDPTTTPYVLVGETMEQLADLIIERVSTLSPAIGGRTTSATFKETLLAEIEKFNGFAAEGVDPEFLRGSTAYNIGIPHGPFNPESTIEYPSADQPNVSMYPISAEGPFYATLVAPAAVDSSGGPVINVNAQILRWNGTPVEGLYGAGNCIANPGYDAYWGGGATLGNAHVWGYMAAKHAIASDEKTV